jgi:hypothetical protein
MIRLSAPRLDNRGEQAGKEGGDSDDVGDFGGGGETSPAAKCGVRSPERIVLATGRKEDRDAMLVGLRYLNIFTFWDCKPGMKDDPDFQHAAASKTLPSRSLPNFIITSYGSLMMLTWLAYPFVHSHRRYFTARHEQMKPIQQILVAVTLSGTKSEGRAVLARLRPSLLSIFIS